MSRLMVSMVLIAWVLEGCAVHSQIIKGDQVYLYLKDPGSQTAFFASSLDGFKQHPLSRHNDKTWYINLPADQEFTYFYIMDSQPFIPDCHYKETDDFGSENCVFLPGL